MQSKDKIIETIRSGQAVLGMELGSTRIKAVLIDTDKTPIASGSYDWENQYVDHIWTYDIDEVQKGVQGCYRDLVRDVKEKYDVTLTRLAGMGVSAMMHGYLAFDEKDELLVPFRTWRNTITGEASKQLSELFQFHIPQRWSIAHLYQAILNGEEHVKDIAYLTTLAGYVHWKLTGKKVLGIGEASGMFPVDPKTKQYDKVMLKKFNDLVKGRVPFKVEDILPKILLAGEDAGTLTEEGVFGGKKTEKEKFAGAVDTYTMEAMMLISMGENPTRSALLRRSLFQNFRYSKCIRRTKEGRLVFQ